MSKQTFIELEEELGRAPTDDEMADAEAAKIDKAYDQYKDAQMRTMIFLSANTPSRKE